MKKLSIIAALLISANLLNAKVELPSVISDNMVLQQNTDVALWGKAKPGSKVTVKPEWTNEKFTTNADKVTGKWLLRVKTPSAGGPYEINFNDGEEIKVSNVLIGEVWYCSGQSNMEMPMKGYRSQPATGAAEFIAKAKKSRPIRLCNIECNSSTQVLEYSNGMWEEHTPQAVANTSATAYFFAEELQSVIDVPVGIVVSSWGGSSIETWIRRDYLEKDFPELEYGHLDGEKEVRTVQQDPCLLFNGQVAPLVPYTFKGMIWYQGETNRGRENQYIRLQETYVRMMRELFCIPDAPFYFVQIAPYPYDKAEDWTSGYFYEAQQKSLDVIPNSGMAVTCDAGEYGTIHPAAKKEVGHRLAFLALARNYGINAINADSPVYRSAEFTEGKAIVEFDTRDDEGLAPMGRNIQGFEISGDDRIFHKADAYVNDGNKVIVSSKDVPEPVAVRYCFRNWCYGNLYNNYGIPAAPFRTDSWDL